MATKPRRATAHAGRKNSAGSAYSPRHNDRRFEIEHAKHIDEAKTVQNLYWSHYSNGWYPDREKGENQSFDEVEHRAYAELFGDALERQNANYIKNNHPERVKTIDEMRAMPRYAPQEELLYIGDRTQEIDRKVFLQCLSEYLRWDSHEHPQVRILDVAIHADEEGAVHAHIRKCFITKDGRCAQEEALKEMGYELPDASKTRGRKNNRKMVYTAECRDAWIRIGMEHGLKYELTPAKDSGKPLKELQEERDEAERLRIENAKLRQQIQNERNELEALRGRVLEAKELKMTDRGVHRIPGIGAQMGWTDYLNLRATAGKVEEWKAKVENISSREVAVAEREREVKASESRVADMMKQTRAESMGVTMAKQELQHERAEMEKTIISRAKEMAAKAIGDVLQPFVAYVKRKFGTDLTPQVEDFKHEMTRHIDRGMRL